MFQFFSPFLSGKAEASTANLRPNADSPKMKRTVVSERFVETAIVADRSMLEHHGREDLQSYLFTLMNVVSQHCHIWGCEMGVVRSHDYHMSKQHLAVFL